MKKISTFRSWKVLGPSQNKTVLNFRAFVRDFQLETPFLTPRKKLLVLSLSSNFCLRLALLFLGLGCISSWPTYPSEIKTFEDSYHGQVSLYPLPLTKDIEVVVFVPDDQIVVANQWSTLRAQIQSCIGSVVPDTSSFASTIAIWKNQETTVSELILSASRAACLSKLCLGDLCTSRRCILYIWSRRSFHC